MHKVHVISLVLNQIISPWFVDKNQPWKTKPFKNLDKYAIIPL